MNEFVIKNKKKLRYGITTGTCAAAAAQAAASLLILNNKKSCVDIVTPKGKRISIDVYLRHYDENMAEYMVIKDSGDDPDVTNKAEIYARVEIVKSGVLPENVFRSEEYRNLYLDGGEGVGRVTKKGLEQKIGCAAINTVPRSMIFSAVGKVCNIGEFNENLLITISVPMGRELAKKTFNPRLGIEGGISILGTSGIIEPMSEKAIVDTIETEIKQLKALGNENLVITPGNYGQGYLSRYLNIEKNVKCSNYIGETIDMAAAYGFKNLLIVGNIGKLVKLAAGIMNTHSKTADGRGEIFALHYLLAGGKREKAIEIMKCINTDEMLEIIDKEGLREKVMKSICNKINEHIKRRGGNEMRTGAVLFSEKFGLIGQTEEAEYILKKGFE